MAIINKSIIAIDFRELPQKFPIAFSGIMLIAMPIVKRIKLMIWVLLKGFIFQ